MKLIDFGTAKRFDLGPLTTKAQRPPKWVFLWGCCLEKWKGFHFPGEKFFGCSFVVFLEVLLWLKLFGWLKK